MRKFIIASAVTFITALLFSKPTLPHGFYPECGIVKEISNNEITVELFNGNLFSFYAEDGDWFVDDICSMIMYDNGTETIYDDEIVSVKYCGYID